MSSQTRTLLVILALAFLGVSGLALMAHRYGKILEQKESGATSPRSLPSASTTDTAEGLVDRFIFVRSAVRSAIDGLEAREPQIRDLAAAREKALLVSGMDTDTYLTVRRVYRAWRDGRERKGTPLANAFEARRESLMPLDLGKYEQLD